MGDTTFNIGSQRGDSISNVAGDQINIDTGQSPEPSGGGVSATVLFLAADPTDLARLRLSEEVRTIEERLRNSNQPRVKLEQEWAVRAQDVIRGLLEHQPRVVHFGGHGSSRGEIYLEDDDATGAAVAPRALARLLQSFDGVRCVVLNACYSAMQAAAIAEVVPCVIGTSQEIGDEQAIRFAGGFYLALAHGKSIGDAFDIGRSEMELSAVGGDELPQILARDDVDPRQLWI